MNKIEWSSILHIQKSNMAYCYDENTIHLLLKTKKDDLAHAKVYYQDPFNWGNNLKEVEMRKVGSSDIHDFWFVEIYPEHKRLAYFFELTGVHGDKCLLNQNGVHDFSEFHWIKNDSQFKFPWMNKEDVYKAPDWVKDTIWYQIFPERFANGNPEINPPNTLKWASVNPQSDSFFGGDLQGIIDHLDHLVELGVNGLYLCPIFKARSNHKYDTLDYFEIDPNFGDKETFKKLVDECHKRGIKVMLDAVFNHVSYWHPFWQDVVENQEKSKYKDWFHIKRFPVPKMHLEWQNVDHLNLSYHTFSFIGDMPKLNTGNPEVRKYLLDVGKYWVENFDIDGWRLDAPNEVDHSFWREFRIELNKIKKIYILGEIWYDSNPWLFGDQFDGVTNYVLTGPVVGFSVGHMSPEHFKNRIVKFLTMYQANVIPNMLNCMDSHDTPRLLNSCGHNVDRFKLAFSILFTLSGAPSIYYGSEIGLDGEHDPGNRKCMIWDKSKWNMNIFDHMKKLCQVRKEHPVLGSYGLLEFGVTDNEKQYVEYFKFDKDNKYVVMINNSDKELNIDHLDLENKVELLTDEVQTSNVVNLKPISMKIFKIK
ncbi:glycoside hydrolase family 13 protein [Mycoplasma cottewii]|uniref:Glycoside hydrolase family 13 protein n=1 Tax=Mycoplasma cottewii TaxID=51364 RepID=A0ABY5TZB1_9MOLU|nr:glycoside hydrolase family 13 protein [Mycoplasma cottewii]UWD34896.1 glycoside hydrolase family 13 protein [Mycoplasma cottewii]